MKKGKIIITGKMIVIAACISGIIASVSLLISYEEKKYAVTCLLLCCLSLFVCLHDMKKQKEK